MTSPWLRVPLVVIVAVALQASVVAELRIDGISLDLLLLLAVAGGIAGGAEVGAVCGFVAGLAMDLLLATPFGSAALAYSLAGWTAGRIGSGPVRGGMWSRAATVAVATLVGVAAFLALTSVLGHRYDVDVRLAVVVAVLAVGNAVLSRPAVAVARWAFDDAIDSRSRT